MAAKPSLIDDLATITISICVISLIEFLRDLIAAKIAESPFSKASSINSCSSNHVRSNCSW
jgi:hypothetical protein